MSSDMPTHHMVPYSPPPPPPPPLILQPVPEPPKPIWWPKPSSKGLDVKDPTLRASRLAIYERQLAVHERYAKVYWEQKAVWDKWSNAERQRRHQENRRAAAAAAPQLLLTHASGLQPATPSPPKPPPPSMVQLTELFQSVCISAAAARPVPTISPPPLLLPPCVHPSLQIHEAIRVASACTLAPPAAVDQPAVFIPTLRRAAGFADLMEKHLADYGGGVWAVLNNIYDEGGAIQLTHAEGYVELLPKHSNLKLWLLPPTVTGLAAVRADIIRRTAGHPIIMMDDDAQSFLLTKKGTGASGYECHPFSAPPLLTSDLWSHSVFTGSRVCPSPSHRWCCACHRPPAPCRMPRSSASTIGITMRPSPPPRERSRAGCNM